MQLIEYVSDCIEHKSNICARIEFVETSCALTRHRHLRLHVAYECRTVHYAVFFRDLFGHSLWCELQAIFTIYYFIHFRFVARPTATTAGTIVTLSHGRRAHTIQLNGNTMMMMMCTMWLCFVFRVCVIPTVRFLSFEIKNVHKSLIVLLLKWRAAAYDYHMHYNTIIRG